MLAILGCFNYTKHFIRSSDEKKKVNVYINIHTAIMVQTRDGAKNSDWLQFIKEMSEVYRERQLELRQSRHSPPQPPPQTEEMPCKRPRKKTSLLKKCIENE